ncbi:Baeyer-Villiger monooxygenase [Penicillium argentinense]|uniref:Baeyer-Villiger monooxygenase n=1 Tax=Penicillium argentinense TaxID=1131581 RepID=A0A9W9EZD3_9EURO|nr:Baeyer-Villiger monooxygenase [Penicillium argentinense]KAJ5090814.1 Baeyer-Villiger monooxygenase [Penicillium argentinense]
MNGINRSLLFNVIGYEYTDLVAVTSVAERRDVETTDQKAKGSVYGSGCSSWFIDERTRRNTTMYPDWQLKF